MGALVTVLQGVNLLFTVIIPDIATALHIKSLFDLKPDFTANVTTLSGDAIAADDAVIAKVNDWRAAHGLPALSIPATAIPPNASTSL
jgi:hypothetical protein